MIRATNKKLELAWAAGFFDGEGCIYKSKSSTSNRYYPTISVSQCYRQPLERFAAAVGYPERIYGPYNQKNANAKPYWVYNIRNCRKAIEVISKILPYMSEPKREQAQHIISDCIQSLDNNPIIYNLRDSITGQMIGGHVDSRAEVSLRESILLFSSLES